MALQNYSGSRRNPFDDDEDITSASDRLGPSFEDEKVLSEEERRRNELLQQMKQVEQNFLESSKRSLGMLIESEKIGIETAQDLSQQREQLSNTENRLDDINSTLKDTQKNINGIKSVFSNLKQWWSAPKKTPVEDKESKSNPASPLSLTPSEKTAPVLSKNLSSAVQKSQNSIQSTKSSHPGLRIRGLEEDTNTSVFSSDFRARTKKVDEQLDSDLENMSSGLGRLKDLAKGLGTEIEDQNILLDRIQTKADKADIVMHSQNAQMNRLLKK